MISQTAEYALRAAVYLAENPQGLHAVPAIARATKVPPPYLAKVLQSLAHHGLLHSQRGIGGGFALARPADQTNLYDIVQAVDPIARIATCPLDLPHHARQLCPLHRRIDDAARRLEQSLRETTLAELLSTGPVLAPPP